MKKHRNKLAVGDTIVVPYVDSFGDTHFLATIIGIHDADEKIITFVCLNTYHAQPDLPWISRDRFCWDRMFHVL